jgi:hypothetical protein
MGAWTFLQSLSDAGQKLITTSDGTAGSLERHKKD